MIILYGIKNCDTIKKAQQWLSNNHIEFQFHDYRKDGITTEMVKGFCDTFGWEAVLNKRGTTYRQLTDEQKSQLNNETVIQLLVDAPAMIKRPILISEHHAFIGFSTSDYATLAQ